MVAQPGERENTTASASPFGGALASASALLLASMPLAAYAADESAGGGESPLKSLFKTVPLSLIHPITMDLLLLSAVYAFYLGWKVRQLRTTDDKELKKKLGKERPGARHFQLTSAMLAVMTITTFEGMANTFVRAGKLFPGPHLYVGLSMVSLMATMASLVPAMNRGNVAAKNAHFVMAFAVLSGFSWQLKTGFAIVSRLLGWSS